jgi:Flp pilus assembly protein TadB
MTLIPMTALVFAALLVLALLLLGALRDGDRGKGLVTRIERYGPRHAPAPPAGDGKVASTAVSWTARLLASGNTDRRLAQRLDLAGISRRPAEWALLGGCASVVLAAVLTTLLGNAFIGILAGAVGGWLGMRLALSVKIGRRRAAFSEQLPNVLQLVAGSLQSGFSLPQALDAVVREETQPAAGEFSRALAEARLGVDLGVALDGVAGRMESDDLRWTVMAIRIQREVGGNLAEVLRNTVDTMRERAYLRRHVQALSAEGRLSAYILVALPVLVGGWLLLTSRTYMRPLYTTAPGVLMLVSSVVLVIVGALWMRKLIKVEV